MKAFIIRQIITLLANLLGIETISFSSDGPHNAVARLVIDGKAAWCVVGVWGVMAVTESREAALWRCREFEARRTQGDALQADAQAEPSPMGFDSFEQLQRYNNIMNQRLDLSLRS